MKIVEGAEEQLICGVCGRHVFTTDYEVPTDLIPFRCNMVFKLSCGHYMVDDCSLMGLEGKCYKDKISMLRELIV